MLRTKTYVSFLIISFLILSCNNSEKKEAIEVANYSINTSGIIVAWTAFKFTDKVGVKGVFNTFKIDSKTKSGTLENLLENSDISIETASVNSNSEIRDTKLRKLFFKTFNTDTIKGNILKAHSGNGILTLNMNYKTNEVDYNYSFKADTISLKTTLDLSKWKAEKALDTLNNACYDLHKGEDGISKLWPNVSIEIKIPVTKTKNEN